MGQLGFTQIHPIRRSKVYDGCMTHAQPSVAMSVPIIFNANLPSSQQSSTILRIIPNFKFENFKSNLCYPQNLRKLKSVVARIRFLRDDQK